MVNLGGHVDQIFEANISDALSGMAMARTFADVPDDQRAAKMAEVRRQIEVLTGMAFATVALALDSLLNFRLRRQ